MAERYLKDSEQAGPDRLVASDRAESGRDVEPSRRSGPGGVSGEAISRFNSATSADREWL